jgi:excisionase family DNA binding protein
MSRKASASDGGKGKAISEAETNNTPKLTLFKNGAMLMESANGSKALVGPFGTKQTKDQGLLTVEEVAELLHVPISWVYERTRRRSSDRIPGFRLGKYWRFREADISAWILKRQEGHQV